MVMGKLIFLMQKNKIEPYLTAYTKTRSKLIKDLNLITKTIRLLEENIGKNLHDLLGFL